MVGTSIWKCLKKERICLCAYSAGTIIFPFKFSAKGEYIEKPCKEMTEINFEINMYSYILPMRKSRAKRIKIYKNFEFL